MIVLSIQQLPSLFQDFFVLLRLFFKVFLIIEYILCKKSSILSEKLKSKQEINKKNFFKKEKTYIKVFRKSLETVILETINPSSSKPKTNARNAPFVKSNKNKKVIIADKQLKNISPKKTKILLLNPIFLVAFIISKTSDNKTPSQKARNDADSCDKELISHIDYLNSLEKKPVDSLSSDIYTTA